MDLNEARHVLMNTARINEGGYVADCRGLVLRELDRFRETSRAVLEELAQEEWFQNDGPRPATMRALTALHEIVSDSATDWADAAL